MFNNHCHSDLSYCSEGGMSLDYIAQVIDSSPSLDGAAVTDHSFQLYFPEDVAWSWEFMMDSSIWDNYRKRGHQNCVKYFAELEKYRDKMIFPGIEVEMMHDGRLTIEPEFLDGLQHIIGSIHWIDILPNASESEALKIWMDHTFKLLDHNITILGHPFRVLVKFLDEIPSEVIKDVVARATANDIALELNSHFEIDTDVAMLRECCEQNAKIAFSTDAHRRDEIDDFSYHFKVLDNAGISLDDLNIFNPVCHSARAG